MRLSSVAGARSSAMGAFTDGGIEVTSLEAGFSSTCDFSPSTDDANETVAALIALNGMMPESVPDAFTPILPALA